jgi:hypothetical protein
MKLNLTAWGTASLGEVIGLLERCEPGADVQFDFCYLSPTTVDSYRGYYDHLALGWEQRAGSPYWPTVSEVLTVLRGAVDKDFEGYKGGTYRMSEDTPLWVANYRHTGGTGIVEIEASDHTVILHTRKVD